MASARIKRKNGSAEQSDGNKAQEPEASLADSAKKPAKPRPKKPATRAVPNGESAPESNTATNTGAPAVRTPGRTGFLTVRDRKEIVEELPSFKQFPADLEAPKKPVVDAEAPRPPAPPPPPPEPQASGMIDRGAPIPERYGMDRVHALIRDPHWLYVYWELTGGNLERLRFKYSGDVMSQARWVLKVDAPLAQQTQLVDIDLRTGCWYLRVEPEGRYRVELGCFTPDGVYEAICSSREVATPRVGLSPVVSEQWMVLREDLQKLLQAGGAPFWAEWKDSGASERTAPGPIRTDFPRAAAFFSGRLAPEKKP